jgi:predicted Zn-dependent protease with MMP-like domain
MTIDTVGPVASLARVEGITRERFEEMVAAAIDDLPPDLARAVDNVAVVVESRAAGTPLYGLYQGVPLTRRGSGYAGALPDRITIYQDQICDSCATEEQVVAQVRKTVLHEFGHHFGISDARLHELGWA